MNKLFTKIGVAMVGLAMAIGVGVAVGSNTDVKKVDAAAAAHGYGELTGSTPLFDGAKILITTTSEANTPVNYYLPAGTAYTSSSGINVQPTFSGVGDIDESHLWTVTETTVNQKTAYKFSFTKNDTTYYLRVSGTGTGKTPRIGSDNTNNIWYVASVSNYYYSLQCTTGSNYFGVYTSGSDWRVYGSATADNLNGTGRNIRFYAPKYTVTYDGNGSDGGIAVSDASSPYTYKSSVTVKTNTWTRAGYDFAGWNTKANGTGTSRAAGASFSITEDVTLYAQWEFGGTVYSIDDSAVTNGHLSNTSDVPEGETYSATLVPDTHYHLPASITVQMGAKELDSEKNEYSYSTSTGAISVPNVNGTIAITAACQEDTKYQVTYKAGSNGTGSDYKPAKEYPGSYTLISAAALSTAGIRPNAGYKFDHYEIGGVTYAAGASYTISADVDVIAVFVALANKITIDNSYFVNSGYTDNNKAHSIGDYEVTTNNVMKSTASGHQGEIQFKRNEGVMYNTTIGFTHGIKMIKIVGTGSITVTFDTSIKSVAGSIESKNAVSSLGSNVRYFVPNSSDACIYFHIAQSNSDIGYFTLIEVYSSTSAATEFASMYLNAYTCTASGASVPSAKSGYTVANIKTLYDQLDSTTQGLLGDAVDAAILDHDKDSYASTLEEFGCRYYFIVKNHGDSYDFMGKAASIGAAIRNNLSVSGDTNDSATLIIIFVSTISLVTIAGYFVIRRRKEQ